MASRTLFLSALVLQAATASAQLSPTTFAGVPLWADSALRTAGLGARFRLGSELNPVFEFGAFDRDGLFDIAIEVKDTGGFRCGIAVAHRRDRSVHIVGAGHPVGSGRDQLACRGSWGVQTPRHTHGGAHVGPDLIFVVERGAIGWLVWDGHAYQWVGAA